MRRSDRTSGRPDAEAARRDGFRRTLTVLAVLGGVALWTQLPARFTPSSLAGRFDAFAVVWPQKWDFFSSEPNTPQLTAYRAGPYGETTVAVAPTTSASNRWGLAHSTAGTFYELDALAGEVPSGDWADCAGPGAASCRARLHTVVLADDFRPALLCGALILVRGQSQDASVRITCPS
ncbi:MAG TPA: hypothetical protein VL551_33775 [Actinospica sp.]|jgi:hypothetical protein|nr:hypothetical protein [Actinospica sp.]